MEVERLYSDALPLWAPPRTPRDDAGPLQMAFEASFTLSELVSSHKSDDDVVHRPPLYEARQGLCCFARVLDMSAAHSGRACARFLFQDASRRIVVDVLGAARAAPTREMSSSRYIRIGNDSPDPPGPVIPVRYCTATRGSASFQKFLDATARQRNSLGQTFDEVAVVDADSAEELEITLRWLTDSTCLVDPLCLAAFDASILVARKGLFKFKMGYVAVPPCGPEHHDSPSDFPCSGPGCSARTTQRCARCSGACYCSVACQRAHWPVHKRVCASSSTGKADPGGPPRAAASSSEVLQEDAAGRPSVLLTFINDLPPGFVFTAIPTNGSAGGKLPTIDDVAAPAQAPINTHAETLFVVKVQTTAGASPEFSGKVVIYDRERSFTSVKVAPVLDAFVRDRGVRGGIKAYCEARREGDLLRVYIDAPVTDARRVDF
jgi:hypothetical protein